MTKEIEIYAMSDDSVNFCLGNTAIYSFESCNPQCDKHEETINWGIEITGFLPLERFPPMPPIPSTCCQEEGGEPGKHGKSVRNYFSKRYLYSFCF